MPYKVLKHVFKKTKDSCRLIERLAGALGLDFEVRHQEGVVLRAGQGSSWSGQTEISVQGLTLGVFCFRKEDADAAGHVLELIVHLLKKEIEKRKIGTEVLSLYREINMIYNFSEHLSEKIDATSIAMTALREAAQIIRNDLGWVVLYPEKQSTLEWHFLTDEARVELHSFIRSFVYQSSSEIVAPDRLGNNAGAMLYSPLKIKDRILGMLVLAHRDPIQYKAADLKLLTTLSLQAATAMETANLFERNIREVKAREEAVRRIFRVTQRFVPREFIRSLGKADITEVDLGDAVEREVTVLFADIRDYTSLSEGMSPEDNFKFVNAFNQRMGPIIERHGGFINQYLGDGFMAIFPERAQDALSAAVGIQRQLHNYNRYRIKRGRRALRMGIGMQTGSLVMGITGDQQRMAAVIISDTVNTAARIEGLAKHYGASILLSENCKNKLIDPATFDFRYLGLVRVKGKRQPIKIFECINGEQLELLQLKSQSIDVFHQGIRDYLKGDFNEALTAFRAVVEHNPKDQAAHLFFDKTRQLLHEGVNGEWNGIELMEVK